MRPLALLCLCILFGAHLGQDTPQPMQQSSNDGLWKNVSESQESRFPRYYICGAEMNYYKKSLPNTCVLYKDKGYPFVINCTGGQTMWQRSNSLSFKYCNFQNWEDQTSAQFFGSYEWQPARMCPRDYYVNGFQTKINTIDGFNALLLNCRHRFNENSCQNVIVKDGVGNWSNQTLMGVNFATSYEVKVTNDYLTGLKLNFGPFPTIINMSIQYENIPIKDFYVDTFATRVFENKNSDSAPINSVFNSDEQKKTKSYGFAFYNTYRNKYHGQRIKKFISDNYKQLLLLTPTIVSKAEAPQIDVDRKLWFRFEKYTWEQFQFGKTLTRGIPITPSITITTPACTKTEVRERIYTLYVQIPYTMTITYSTLGQTFDEKIIGIFKGNVFSTTEIISTQYSMCV